MCLEDELWFRMVWVAKIICNVGGGDKLSRKGQSSVRHARNAEHAVVRGSSAFAIVCSIKSSE